MYKIMHRNDVIALADENKITEIIRKEKCPTCFVIGMLLEDWLNNRCIDIHRPHSRQLFKALRMRTDVRAEQLIEVGHGISITDNWWIQKENEDLSYDSLKEYNETFANIALNGSSEGSNITKGYKELGTVGSYEKCWKYIDNHWFMYKHGTTAELISEYYSYCFLKSIGIPVAEYSIHKGKNNDTGLDYTYMVSRDFTNNAEYDFEPFCNYFNDHEESEYIIPKLDEKLVKDYIMLLFYDVLLYNGDRHNQNIGFLRDSKTGEIISLAPCFDYNLALISTGTPRIDIEKGNLLANSFLENEICRKVLKDNLPERGIVESAVKAASAGIREKNKFSRSIKTSYIGKYILAAYDYVAKNI